MELRKSDFTQSEKLLERKSFQLANWIWRIESKTFFFMLYSNEDSRNDGICNNSNSINSPDDDQKQN